MYLDQLRIEYQKNPIGIIYTACIFKVNTKYRDRYIDYISHYEYN